MVASVVSPHLKARAMEPSITFRSIYPRPSTAQICFEGKRIFFEGQYFHLTFSSLVVDAFFFTRLVTNVFHDLAGFDIQNNATTLSIQTVTETTGSCFNAWHTFFAMFAAICPLISSNLGIDVFLLEIRALALSKPFTVPVECSTTAIVVHEHARAIASAKMCRWISLIFRTPFVILRRILTLRSCLVHFNQSCFKCCETSASQLFISSQASRLSFLLLLLVKRYLRNHKPFQDELRLTFLWL